MGAQDRLGWAGHAACQHSNALAVLGGEPGARTAGDTAVAELAWQDGRSGCTHPPVQRSFAWHLLSIGTAI